MIKVQNLKTKNFISVLVSVLKIRMAGFQKTSGSRAN